MADRDEEANAMANMLQLAAEFGSRKCRAINRTEIDDRDVDEARLGHASTSYRQSQTR